MSATSNLTLGLEELVNSIWTYENDPTWYDTGACLQQNVTLSNRVNLQDNFNFCSVPLSGADAFLFASLALLVASLCMGKLQSVWVLIIGGALGILNYEVNLYHLGNAIALWLGVQPPDLFFYAFLPPLLVDAALRLDWYIFSKLWPHIVLMAYAMVILNAAVLAPFILFVLGFSSRGWDWIHGAVLAAMLAPTDAVAVTAILKAGGGPEHMVVLMEGEALLNDASAVTLYTVFLGILESSSPDDLPSVTSQLWPICVKILKLTGIGVGLGLAFAWTLGYLLRLLRWRGVQPYIESLVVLATGYLCFYVTQAPCKGSGVIAVCVFGLYGSATGHWGMLATDAESGVHEAVWDSVAFAANALIFFWSGISAVNFVRRAASQLETNAWNYAAIPLIFLFMYAFRLACALAFNPLFRLMGRRLSLPEATFATVAGLRGALTLIMAADFIIHSDFYNGGAVGTENFDVVLWSSAFVLLSLLINAPLIGPVMRWTGLSRISPDKVAGRRRALDELAAFTVGAVAELKQQQDGEFLQGANWQLVERFVDHSARLRGFVPKPRPGSGAGAAGCAGRMRGCFGPCCRGKAAGDAPPADKGGGGGTLPAREASRSADDAADMEVAFIPRRSSALTLEGLARLSGGAAGAPLGPALNVAALAAVARGSFYDPISTADAAATAAAAAVAGVPPAPPPAGRPPRSVRFGSGVDVASAGSPPAPSASASAVADGEEEVETLFARAPGGEAGPDFELRWHHSLQRVSAAVAAQPDAPASPPAPDAEPGWRADALHAQLAAGGAPPATEAAALVRRQATGVAASRAAVAGAGSNRDLLGRLEPPAAPGAPPGGGGPGGSSRTLSSALLSRLPTQKLAKQVSLHVARSASLAAGASGGADLEAGGGGADDSPKSGGSDGAGGGPAGGGLLEQRLRVLHGMKRHFRSKRMAGLLSPDGLRVATYSCDKAIEMAEHDPALPLQLWPVLRREIGGTWATHAVAAALGGTLRAHRAAPAWWRAAASLPFRLFTGVLRRHLGARMLIACEAAVELYMGLAASPQMQWVYFSEDGPVEVLPEVQAQLAGAVAFVQEREAEAPAQYRAVQSYRAAMAVLRQQRTFIADLHERGGVDEEERDALGAAVDAAMRMLDMTGPVWRPPAPAQVVASLDVFAGAPPELTEALLARARLQEYKPEALVWSSEGAAADGFLVVVGGVVRHDTGAPDGGAGSTLAGVGSLLGLLPGLAGCALPGGERVTACGNSFGRGATVYHFTAAAVKELRARVEAGEPAAAALEVGLLRCAALQVVQHVQGDVQGLVRSFLELHRPLTKYSASAPQQPERVGRYTAQVLLDILQATPTAAVVRLRSGDRYQQGAHMLLLQGSLKSAAGGGSEGAHAPAVLPWLTHTRFSFVAAAAQQAQQRLQWTAGGQGATLLVCGVASVGNL